MILIIQTQKNEKKRPKQAKVNHKLCIGVIDKRASIIILFFYIISTHTHPVLPSNKLS